MAINMVLSTRHMHYDPLLSYKSLAFKGNLAEFGTKLREIIKGHKSFFSKADMSCIVSKYDWLQDINFFIKKSIKKDGNNIYLVDTIA